MPSNIQSTLNPEGNILQPKLYTLLTKRMSVRKLALFFANGSRRAYWRKNNRLRDPSSLYWCTL